MSVGASALAIGAGFLVLGLAQQRLRLSPMARRTARAGLALGAGLLIAPPQQFIVGGGRVLELAPWFAHAGAAFWIFLMASAMGAIARRHGPAFACACIGLAALALAAWAAGALDAAAAAGALALIAGAAAAFDIGRGKLGEAVGLGLGGAGAAASLMVITDGGISPFIPALLFLPLLADALLAFAHGGGIGGGHWFELGQKAGLQRAHVGWAYWFVSGHCALIALIASEAGRRAALQDGAALDALSGKLMLAASLAPLIAFAASALVLLRVSSVLRRFSAELEASGRG